MFHTIPTIQKIEFTIVGETSSGKEKEFGWSIPGLKQINLRDNGRYHYSLLRMIHFYSYGLEQRERQIKEGDPEPDIKETKLLDDYLVAVAEELKMIDPEIEQFSLRVDAMFTFVPLDDIELGDPTSGLVTDVYGPFPVSKE